MSTEAVTISLRKMSEADVIRLIAEALETSPQNFTLETQASDIPQWDSMGTLCILSSLDRERIVCDIGDVAALQTVRGVVETFRSAGRLQ